MVKILKYVLVILIATSTVTVQAEEFDLNKVGGLPIELDLEQVKSIYDQTIPEIVEDYDIDYIYKWIKGSPRKALYTTTFVAVHEETHVYSNPDGEPVRKIEDLYIEFTGNEDGDILRIKAEGEVYDIIKFKPFKSENMLNIIPEEYEDLQMKSYIKGPEYSSNMFGLFGLLDEYNAFNKEAQYLVSLYDKVDSGYVSVYRYRKLFYEFKYMILTYLIYAEEYETEDFTRFLEDKELRKAFTSVDNEVNDLLLDLERIGADNSHSLLKIDIVDELKTKAYQNMYRKFKFEEPKENSVIFSGYFVF